jgi:hypothetical protein
VSYSPGSSQKAGAVVSDGIDPQIGALLCVDSASYIGTRPHISGLVVARGIARVQEVAPAKR